MSKPLFCRWGWHRWEVIGLDLFGQPIEICRRCKWLRWYNGTRWEWREPEEITDREEKSGG